MSRGVKNERAEMISTILSMLLASDDIDSAIISLSRIVEGVCSNEVLRG